MKIEYSVEANIAYIRFNDHPVADSDEAGKGVIVDYDADGNICGLEILDAQDLTALKEQSSVTVTVI